ncbi:MAG: long-chain fatty acid--CoA ligase [Deltaproteobacteria bacterium]|nr:long-chain fatty acid--CoA ligase [Deltaproteobacteria bacterium]
MKLDDIRKPEIRTRPVSAGARTIADLLVRRAEISPRRRAWRSKQAGRWVGTTWADVRRQAAAVASWLASQGLEVGDKVLVVGSTRPQWCLCDLGGQLSGLVTIGAYPTLSQEQLAYVIDHSDSRVVFVEGAQALAAVRAVRDQCPALERIVVWDTDGIDDADDIIAFAQVLRTDSDEPQLARRREAVEPDATAIIVYTSGTTGPPKGAMLSHTNILAFLNAGMGLEFGEDDESLTFLPMAHVAERIAGFYMRLNMGTGTAFASSIPAVLEEVKEVRPTLFGSVPRIFEKAYDRIQAQVDAAPAVRQRLFRWAERVGLQMVDHWQRGENAGLGLTLRYRVADRVVYQRIREAFGGRVRFFVTGAAPIPQPVLRFFWAVGFPIFEAYGQTEATVITHANRPDQTRLGSVGKPVPGVQQRLADDGEVLIRGSMVFRGYHKNPEATDEAIGEGGWLHTGDIGRIDDEGYLFIVDRKKHIIITAGGKNLTPANIENEIKSQDPMISQVHAHGDRRPYVSALMTLSPLDAIEWARKQGMTTTADAEQLRRALMEDPLARPPGLDTLLSSVGQRAEIRNRVVAAVRRGNAKLSKVERVKRVVLLERELSLAEDEITPTLKVKRKNIERGFADRFDRLYDDAAYGLTIEHRRP